MTRLISAPAVGPAAITPDQFIRALKPQPSELDVLIGNIWNAVGDPEALERAHRKLAEYRAARWGEPLTEVRGDPFFNRKVA